MKNVKKILTISLCLVAVVAATVVGTLAYLADQEVVTNTFTVGQVDITVDEARVNPDGTEVEGAERVDGNQYHLIPGQTYIKDPTMTVMANSEEAYVRMMVTINCKSELDKIFEPEGADLTEIFQFNEAGNWKYVTEVVDTEKNTITYEFRYEGTVAPIDSDGDGEKDDLVLEALFEAFTVPGTLDGDDLKSIEDLTITVVGHAIQAAGFTETDGKSAVENAWMAFGEQHKVESNNTQNP